MSIPPPGHRRSGSSSAPVPIPLGHAATGSAHPSASHRLRSSPTASSPATALPCALRLNFNIRFAGDGSLPDLLNVWVGDRESVREFKRRIQLLRPALGSRRLRLIFLGRVLTDGTLLVPWTELLLRRQNSHLSRTETVTRALGDAVSGALGAVKGGYDAAIGVKTKGKGKEVEPCPGLDKEESDVAVWLQCAVGDVLSAEQGSRAAEQAGEDSTWSGGAEAALLPRPLSGFDRLAEAGFSEEDIDQVRRQFHAQHGMGGSDVTLDVQGDQDGEEHARAMEEQWLEGLNSTQGGIDNALGSQIYMTLFRGLCIGFFFPILPLFFFRTDVMDRRTQLAIVSGTAFNLIFGVLRYTNS